MPQAQPALLIVHSDDTSHAVEPGQGVVTIGREPHADVQIDDPTISQEHLRAECADGQWRIVRQQPGGHVCRWITNDVGTVTDKATVRFGDPTAGKALTFEVVKPPNLLSRTGTTSPPVQMIRIPAWPAPEPRPRHVAASSTSVSAASRPTESSTRARSSLSKRAAAGRANGPGPSSRKCCDWPAGTIARIRRANRSTSKRRQRHRLPARPDTPGPPRGVVDRAGRRCRRGRLQPGHRGVAASRGSRLHRAGGADPCRSAPARGDCGSSDPHQPDHPGIDQGDWARCAATTTELMTARRDRPGCHAGAAPIRGPPAG